MEQSTGIEQVNKALTQMDEVTQQNSALVEENAATAKTLETQAKSMDEQVAFFRIDGTARSKPRGGTASVAKDRCQDPTAERRIAAEARSGENSEARRGRRRGVE